MKIAGKIAGVDEAGKGPVIGPMCVAGVLINEDKLHLIEELGVKDSKKVAPKKRKLLSGRIKETADNWFVLDVSAHQIDELRTIMTMNEVMVICHAKVLENLEPDHAFLDAADVKEERFGRNVQKKCQTPTKFRVTARHKADVRYPIVAAASIIAKVHRDHAIAALREEFGDFGSGYPADPKTIRFLREWFSEHQSFPDVVRHSWKTVENVIASAKQTKLSAYR